MTNSQDTNLQTSPLELKKLLRSDAAVGRLAIEYSFTPPLPAEGGAFYVFAYTTPALPARGFTLNAPDYVILADYPKGTVHSLHPVTPAQLNHPGRELGPLHVVSWSYEEGEANRHDFDRIYAKLLSSFAAGGKGFPSANDCQHSSSSGLCSFQRSYRPPCTTPAPSFLNLLIAAQLSKEPKSLASRSTPTKSTRQLTRATLYLENK